MTNYWKMKLLPVATLQLVLFLCSNLPQFSHSSLFRPSTYIFTGDDLRNATITPTTTTTPRSRSRSNSSKIVFSENMNWTAPAPFPTPPPTQQQKFSQLQSTVTPQPQPSTGTEVERIPVPNSDPGNSTSKNVRSPNSQFGKGSTPTVPVERASPLVCNGTGVRSAEKENNTYLTSEYIRSKLCSTGSEHRIISAQYRFDMDAKVCSPIGRRGHCGKNMLFYSFPGSQVYGLCDCDYSSDIPMVYWDQDKRCYFIYQQGFCKQDEWIELSKANRKGFCAPNKCFNSGRPNRFGAPPLAARDRAPEYVPLRGTGACVRLNENNVRECGQVTGRQYVAFWWNATADSNSKKGFFADCREQPPVVLPDLGTGPGAEPGVPIGPRWLGDVPTLQCNPGSYMTAQGICQPDFDFD